MAMSSLELRKRYWRKTLRVTGLLLFLCFFVTFGVPYFARFLNFTFFGWPFSFWMGAQGALMAYGLIIGFYAWYMNRLDAQLVSDYAAMQPADPLTESSPSSALPADLQTFDKAEDASWALRRGERP